MSMFADQETRDGLTALSFSGAHSCVSQSVLSYWYGGPFDLAAMQHLAAPLAYFVHSVS